MTEHQIADRIVLSRDVLHGKPRIQGTRILVYQILDFLAAGKSIDQIISDEYYPDITEADVLACIAYASQIVRDDEIVPGA